jgi:hypothetical protein
MVFRFQGVAEVQWWDEDNARGQHGDALTWKPSDFSCWKIC